MLYKCIKIFTVYSIFNAYAPAKACEALDAACKTDAVCCSNSCVGGKCANYNGAYQYGDPLAAHNMEFEFDNLLADYNYDLAVERARETRAIQKLKAEKKEIQKAKSKLKSRLLND
eukprot:477930_1